MDDKEIIKILLHDFRDDIVKNNKKCVEIKENWNRYNSLEKAIEFKKLEIHVEADMDVKKKAFSSYCPEFATEYITADIMNGWWYCFKTIYKLDESRKAFRKNHDNMLSQMVNSEEEETLRKYLKVVYTIGNMTPAPYNPGGKGYGEIDFWEYKLERYGKLYHNYNGDIDKLLFQDYEPYIAGIKGVKYREYMETFDLVGYMNDRIDLIIKRGYRILNKRAIRGDELKEVKDYI